MAEKQKVMLMVKSDEAGGSEDTTTIQWDNYTVLKLLLFYLLFGRLLILFYSIAQANNNFIRFHHARVVDEWSPTIVV
jgi:hypothetical protein